MRAGFFVLGVQGRSIPVAIFHSRFIAFYSTSRFVADGIADIFFDCRIVLLEAAGLNDGVAYSAAFAIVVDCASAYDGSIFAEHRLDDNRLGNTVNAFVEDAGAVSSRVGFEEALHDFRAADAVVAVVVDGAAVKISGVVYEAAVDDMWSAFAVAGEVVQTCAFASHIVNKNAIPDGRRRFAVVTVIVPACAGGFDVAIVAVSVGSAATDNDAVNNCAGAYIVGIYNGVRIVIGVVRSDLATQYGTLVEPVALLDLGFETGKAAIQFNAVSNLEVGNAIVRLGRCVFSLSNPNLIAAFGNAKCSLEIAEGIFPGSSVAVVAGFYVEHSCRELCEHQNTNR